MKKLAAFIIVGFFMIACSTNPLTGRQALQLISNDALMPTAFQQYNSVLTESMVVTNTSQARMVKEVGRKLKDAAEQYYRQNGLSAMLQGYQWEFNLIQDEQINAWCMPGGKVAFYTGILPVCQDETGVAVVMGHEIAHALAGHSAERASHAYAAQFGGNLIGGSINNQELQAIFGQLYPIGAQLKILSYSRKQELDADKAGLYLMAMAGFDPRQAPAFWERMNAASNGQQRPPEFMSTHPDPERRRSDINDNMAKALEYYNASK